MSWQNIRYFFREGARSFFVNGVMSAASVIIVTACLAIFGTYLIFGINVNYIGEQFKSQFEIQVFIVREASDARIGEIGKQLATLENVEKCTYVSKADAFQEMQGFFKDKPDALSGYGKDRENPLCASYKVTMKELANVEALVKQIEAMPDIKNVVNNKDALESILKTTDTIQQISLWLMLILAFISVLIISNAIKMTVFARRRDINIMKFVGATDGFIRLPFVVEGVMIGLTGAVVAIIIVLLGYGYLMSFLTELLKGMIALKTVNDMWGIIVGSFLGIGAMLGAIGSTIAVKKHLRV